MKPFDKYDLYKKAVQAPDVDAAFLFNLYKRLKGKPPQTLQEDFCGTFAILCEWVKLNKKNRGLGVDLDPEPIAYGMVHNYSKLKDHEKSRIQIYEQNVLKRRREKADIIAAMNFSYFLFHDRKSLLDYFKSAYANLKEGGLLVADAFGGPACLKPNTDKTRRRGFWYLWEQEYYHPVTHRARFHIHFKRDGEKIKKRVFTYDWRMWSLPEISELMKEAGFKSTLTYCEDDQGNFRPNKKGDSDCEAWIAYTIGIK